MNPIKLYIAIKNKSPAIMQFPDQKVCYVATSEDKIEYLMQSLLEKAKVDLSDHEIKHVRFPNIRRICEEQDAGITLIANSSEISRLKSIDRKGIIKSVIVTP